MMTRLLIRNLCLVSALGALVASAQPDEPPGRLSLSYRVGLNIEAHFKNRGASAVPGGPSVTGLSYADGFVRPNSEPNDLNLSWNWGYEQSSQIVGDNIVMTSSQAGTLSSGVEDAPHHGAELAYNWRVGQRDRWRWGLEGALNYTALEIEDRSAAPGAVLTAHAFSLGGNVPPVPPYAGSPEGPGFLISDTPTPAALRVHSDIETSLAGLRLGPYVEFPLNDEWALSASGGFALAWADSDLRFKEEVVVDSVRGVTRAGKGSKSELLPGWYVGANVSFRLSEEGRLFGGVQFQSLDDHLVRASDKEARLILSRSIFFTAGVSISF